MAFADDEAKSRDERRAHYASFYGSAASEGSAVVLGNCQAESLRLVLDGDDLPTMRVPPVHELIPEDMPLLERALRSAAVVVTQPIRNDYRGLAVGTAQVRAVLASSARLVVVPAIRHRSLHPAQLVVRIAGRDVEDPPIVAYHDARTLSEALGHDRPVLTPSAVRGIATASSTELRSREEQAGAVQISDIFDVPSFSLLRTINHPGNPVWLELATRVRRLLHLDEAVRDPGRALLSSVVAPREQVVIDAWQLETEPDEYWTVGGERIHDDVIRAAHLAWYAEHPSHLRLAAERHAATLDALWAS